MKDYQQQLINELKPLTIWNGKEWVEENKSKNESEEDIMFGVEMFLDTVEGDPEPGLVEFTKTGLIEFLNDYGYDLPTNIYNRTGLDYAKAINYCWHEMERYKEAQENK